jgi:hypothetical protein
MPDTFNDQDQFGGLEGFLASNSPVRASLEFLEGKELVVETIDGRKYAFTYKEVLRKFGEFEAYLAALGLRTQR